VNCRAPTEAFPYGIKPAAAKGPNVVDQTGVIFLEKWTSCNVFFFLLQPVLGNFILDLTLERLGQAIDSLQNNNALKGDDVHISHVCAAIGAPYLADGVFLELIRICLKPLIYLLQSVVLFFQCHSNSYHYPLREANSDRLQNRITCMLARLPLLTG
jgi:hypothetical protein